MIYLLFLIVGVMAYNFRIAYNDYRARTAWSRTYKQMEKLARTVGKAFVPTVKECVKALSSLASTLNATADMEVDKQKFDASSTKIARK